MRLSPQEIQIIKNAVCELDSSAHIYIFGSRVDDNLLGGDVDILVFSKSITFSDKLKIKQLLFTEMEEQKIDLIIAQNEDDPFIKMIREKSVKIQ